LGVVEKITFEKLEDKEILDLFGKNNIALSNVYVNDKDNFKS
jgi:hypothetical protein